MKHLEPSTNYARTHSPAPARPCSGRLLLVDDSREILRATERVLIANNYQVKTASNGEEAIQYARDWLPDVILLDVMMPKVDGLTACRSLKQDPVTSGIMILLVTGRASVDNRVEGLDAGADDYVTKPFAIPELLARIRSAVRLKKAKDDLSEKNKELLQSHEELIQSEKLATIGMLAAGIAHEFNNIMAGLCGYAQLAKHNPKFKDNLVDVAITQSERAKEITQSLSTYYKPSHSKVACSVRSVIKSALCLVAREIETSKTVVHTFLEGDPTVRIRPSDLQKLILNLLLNAIQATKEGSGVVHLRLREDTEASLCLIDVEDNGEGIPPENVHRIFDPFFTTKGSLGGGSRCGTGLGLTVSYNVVRACRGRIWAESVQGIGTTFKIRLPTTKEHANTAAGCDATPPGPPSTSLHLLLVDDEPYMHSLFSTYLHEHTLTVAANAQSALDTYDSGVFDFVILNADLGQVGGGYPIFKALSTRFPAPRVIVCSSNYPDADTEHYLELAHGHLLKPFTMDMLRSLLTAQAALQTIPSIELERA